jgi:hypothetical protein
MVLCERGNRNSEFPLQAPHLRQWKVKRVPHRALALEDILDVDVFCPPRQDWLAGTDAYLSG